jgi:plasmid stabilization system protein ParE
VERQFAWYVTKAGWEVAERYLEAVDSTCGLLAQHPLLGPRGGFTHPRLRDWRFFLVLRPFQKHVLLYEIDGEEMKMRRAMHGCRDLPRRLLAPG